MDHQSFIYQPWNEKEPPSSPSHILKENDAFSNSTNAKPSLKSSLKNSINRSAEDPKRSITLEDRGITYGKKIDPYNPIQQPNQIRRTPKIDCSLGPSEMIPFNALLLVNTYAEINPEKKVKVDIKQEAKSSSEESSLSRQSQSQKVGALPPNGKPKEIQKREANSSAIREKKYKSKFQLAPIILCLILIFLVLSVKHEQTRQFVDGTVVRLYARYFYGEIFE